MEAEAEQELAAPAPTPPAPPAASMGMLERLTKNVLSKPQIWVLAVSFLCVYLMRQGLTTWMVFYLIEGKGTLSPAQP